MIVGFAGCLSRWGERAGGTGNRRLVESRGSRFPLLLGFSFCILAFLVILIDGALRGLVVIPATLSVTNRYPLSIGGKGTSQDNDQFQGALDDVWVRIG